MNSIQQKVKSFRNELIVADVALLLLGALMIVFPATSAAIICRVIGVILCVCGLLRFIAYFAAPGAEVFGSFALVQGAAMAGFGIYFLVRPEYLAAFLTVALAIVLLVGGVMKLQYGIDLARLKVSGWWVELIGAFLMAALGIVAFTDPFDTASALMVFIGIAFLFNGVWDLVSVLYLSSAAKKIKKAAENGGL